MASPTCFGVSNRLPLPDKVEESPLESLLRKKRERVKMLFSAPHRYAKTPSAGMGGYNGKVFKNSLGRLGGLDAGLAAVVATSLFAGRRARHEINVLSEFIAARLSRRFGPIFFRGVGTGRGRRQLAGRRRKTSRLGDAGDRGRDGGRHLLLRLRQLGSQGARSLKVGRPEDLIQLDDQLLKSRPALGVHLICEITNNIECHIQVTPRKTKSLQCHTKAAYMATGEGKFEEFRWAVRAELAEGNVVQAKVLRPWEDVRIGLDPPDHLAEDDAEAEDVAPLVVPLSAEAFRAHPVGRAHGWQPVPAPTNNVTEEHESLARGARINKEPSEGRRDQPLVGDLRRQAKVADDRRQLSCRVVPLYQNILRNKNNNADIRF